MRLLISSCGMLPDIDNQKLTSPCHSAVSVQFWRDSWSSVMSVCWSVLCSRDTVERLRAQCGDMPDCMLISLSFAQPLSFSFTLELNIGLVWISFDFDYIVWSSECFWEHIEWLNVSSKWQTVHALLIELLKWCMWFLWHLVFKFLTLVHVHQDILHNHDWFVAFVMLHFQ